MAHDVFISYASSDKSVADAVCSQLESVHRIRCWIAPRDIMPGASWAGSIIDALDTSKTMVLIFSNHANASVQIEREVERAVHKGIIIIPLRIENAVPSKTLEYFISAPHWLDAMTEPLEKHIARLAASVQALMAKPHSGGAQPAVREEPAPAVSLPAIVQDAAHMAQPAESVQAKAPVVEAVLRAAAQAPAPEAPAVPPPPPVQAAAAVSAPVAPPAAAPAMPPAAASAVPPAAHAAKPAAAVAAPLAAVPPATPVAAAPAPARPASAARPKAAAAKPGWLVPAAIGAGVLAIVVVVGLRSLTKSPAEPVQTTESTPEAAADPGPSPAAAPPAAPASEPAKAPSPTPAVAASATSAASAAAAASTAPAQGAASAQNPAAAARGRASAGNARTVAAAPLPPNLFIDFRNSLSDGTVVVDVDGEVKWSENLGGPSKGKTLNSAVIVPSGTHKVGVSIVNPNGTTKEKASIDLQVDGSEPHTLQIRLSRFKKDLQLAAVAGKPAGDEK